MAVKLCLALYLASCPLIVIAVFMGSAMKANMTSSTEALAQAWRLKENANRSLAFLLIQEAVTKSMLLQPEKMDEVARKIQAHDDNLALLNEMKSIAQGKHIVAIIDQIQQMDKEKLAPLDTKILETLGAAKPDAAKQIYFSEYEPVRAQYEALTRKLGELADVNARNAAKETAEINERSFLNTTVSLLVSTIIIGLMGFFLAQRIGSGLKQTVLTLKDIAEGEGDLTKRLEVRSGDEIGQLAYWFNAFVDKVHDTVRVAGHNAQMLTSSSKELTSVSHQMSSNSRETAAQADVVLAASHQVSKNVQTVVAGAEEMGISIKEIARNAKEASRVASNAVQVAQQTNITVSKLGESGAEIGNVIKVITSIAAQTNLLALNATIEAARAGEAGKGFAVVANEVKELAKQTGKATEEISHKIESIQSTTQEAVQAIDNIGAVINQINSISSVIASAVEEQNTTTHEISRNVGEAARGSQAIVHNITAVAEAAKNTSMGADDTQTAAEELSRMAADLQNQVRHFKCSDNGNGSQPQPRSAQNLAPAVTPPPRDRPADSLMRPL